MKNKLIVANWKMHTGLADALVLAETVKNQLAEIEHLEVVLCPPFIWLVPISESLKRFSIPRLKLGAQNIFSAKTGPYTGEVSILMIKNFCRYVILGHSERREFFSETDEEINNKVHLALENHIRPIICIGEKHRLNRLGRKSGIRSILDQLRQATAKIKGDDWQKITVAYEPVWAIGGRKAANGVYAAEIINEIREEIAKITGQKNAKETRIIYGGSVDQNNIQEFVHQEGIDGAMIGTASLRAKEFVKICQLAAEK